MQTLKIEIPDGYEVDLDKSAGEIRFKEKPKNVMERIKTVADVLSDNDLTEQDFEDLCEELDEDEKAYRLIKLLVKSLNEGWTPDWNNSSEYKYFPYFYMGGSSGFRFVDYDHWNSNSGVGSRLCFKSSELAKYAGTQFIDVYRKFIVV